MEHEAKPSWLLLEDFLTLPEMIIDSETMEVLKELDRLGFYFRAMTLDGQYFECKRSPEIKRFEP